MLKALYIVRTQTGALLMPKPSHYHQTTMHEHNQTVKDLQK